MESGTLGSGRNGNGAVGPKWRQRGGETARRCWGRGETYSKQFIRYRARERERGQVDPDKEMWRKKKGLGRVVLEVWKPGPDKISC